MRRTVLQRKIRARNLLFPYGQNGCPTAEFRVHLKPIGTILSVMFEGSLNRATSNTLAQLESVYKSGDLKCEEKDEIQDLILARSNPIFIDPIQAIFKVP